MTEEVVVLVAIGLNHQGIHARELPYGIAGHSHEVHILQNEFRIDSYLYEELERVDKTEWQSEGPRSVNVFDPLIEADYRQGINDQSQYDRKGIFEVWDSTHILIQSFGPYEQVIL